jgi:uncharacterized protein (UPF0548 family)
LDRSRFSLGRDPDAFPRAKAALQRWKQFELGWVRAAPDDTPIEPNRAVAVVARTLGLWCLCSARIVYVIDEPRRFGFAYGTLPGHVECGEERFLIEQDEDGTVWYDLLAFSRPRHLLAKLGYPYTRRLQRRFARDSGEAMRRATTTPH